VIPETLPFAPACERNKQPILEALQQVLPNSGTVLEIGSGTGQHVVHFAAHLPELQWQPSDRPEYLSGLRLRLQVEGSVNIHSPIMLDVLEEWPDQVFEAVFSANTAHIMGWPAVCAMFAGVAPRLVMGGVFCLYGPFNEDGKFTAPSNAAFDAQLRRESPQMGLRDVEALESLAFDRQMSLKHRFQLPANNQLLVFRKNTGANKLE
jgi:hypothetical protein